MCNIFSKNFLYYNVCEKIVFGVAFFSYRSNIMLSSLPTNNCTFAQPQFFETLLLFFFSLIYVYSISNKFGETLKKKRTVDVLDSDPYKHTY